MGTTVVLSQIDKSPDARSTVSSEVFEEHHMGASTVRMQVSLACRERLPVFYSTGGNSSFTPDSSHLLIWDRKLLVALSTSTGAARIYSPPSVIRLFGLANRPRFMCTLGLDEHGNDVCIELEDGFGQNNVSVRLPVAGKADWTPGLGSAARGLLPSVYGPDYRAIAVERGDA